MPIYEYRCDKCEHEFEREQRITDDPIKTCPACKSRRVKKLISQTNFVLKGSGWYSDLYSGPSNEKDEKKGKDDGDSGSSSGEVREVGRQGFEEREERRQEEQEGELEVLEEGQVEEGRRLTATRPPLAGSNAVSPRTTPGVPGSRTAPA